MFFTVAKKENKGKNILITGMSFSKTPSRKHDEYKIKYTAMSQYISAPSKKIYIEFFHVLFSLCLAPFLHVFYKIIVTMGNFRMVPSS